MLLEGCWRARALLPFSGFSQHPSWMLAEVDSHRRRRREGGRGRKHHSPEKECSRGGRKHTIKLMIASKNGSL